MRRALGIPPFWPDGLLARCCWQVRLHATAPAGAAPHAVQAVSLGREFNKGTMVHGRHDNQWCGTAGPLFFTKQH